MTPRSNIVSFDDARRARRAPARPSGSKRAQTTYASTRRPSVNRENTRSGRSSSYQRPASSSSCSQTRRRSADARAYRDQDAFLNDQAGPRPAVTAFQEEDEEEQPEPGLRGKINAMLRNRTKAKAERAFDRQYQGDAQPEVDGGPRAALYKGEMGQNQRRAARMHQESSGSSSGRLSSRKSAGSGGLGIAAGAVKVLGAALACVVVVGALLYPTAKDYYLSLREHDQVVAELDAVRARNQELAAQVQSLGTAQGIQARAHEDYGWVLPDENAVYVQGIDDGSASGSSVAANVVPGSVKAPETWYSPILDKLFGVEE